MYFSSIVFEEYLLPDIITMLPINFANKYLRKIQTLILVQSYLETEKQGDLEGAKMFLTKERVPDFGTFLRMKQTPDKTWWIDSVYTQLTHCDNVMQCDDVHSDNDERESRLNL